jgi:hypothetical protein
MKDIKQIREQFDLITEKEEKEDRKLSALVRAGLYDAKKLPALKRALEKSADKITSQEKRMLINLLDSLISQVVSDDQVYRKVRQNVHNVSEAKMDTYSKFDPRYKAGWPTDKEMPSVLILKRKAIRVYPDNQKVALYYSQALDKYVTIPYNDIQFGLNEAKKPKDDEEDNKRRRRVATSNSMRARILPKKVDLTKGIDAAQLLNKTGKYTNVSTRLKSLDGHLAGGKAGVLANDLARRALLKLSRSRRNKNKPSSSQSAPESAPKSSSSSAPTPAPTPAAAPKESKSEKIKPLKTRSKKEMEKQARKSPGVVRSAAAQREAKRVGANINVEENFKLNLQMIRESRQLEEGAAKDFVYKDLDSDSWASFGKDMAPGIGTERARERTSRAWKKGNYGSAALNALDTAVSGASDVALASGIGAGAGALIKGARAAVKGGIGVGRRLISKYAAKKAAKETGQKAAKETGKEATSKAARKNKGGKSRGAGRAARLASRFIGSGSGSGNDSTASASKDVNYKFGLKPNTGNSYTQAQTRTVQDTKDKIQNRRALGLEEVARHEFRLKAKSLKSNRNPGRTAQDVKDDIARRKALNTPMVNESNVLNAIKSIVENNISEQTIKFNENEITINNTVAKKLLTVYESINKTNKKKMEQMLNESASSFNKVLMFAVRQ